ncbi:carbohydrate-binding protein [Streptomyces sp. NBC_01460]|uniref:carbohydrate-binding protein n=1 Tax=Streptomyces sp. NBC_01460 TaxID=2903875 RepID=UPI002E31CD04|nr:carbohydrate-binding protein [Streptomyces sp. NBC_01460]
MSPAPRKRSRAAVRLTFPVLVSLLGTVLYGVGGAQAATVTVEAESAQLSGGAAVSTDHSGYTGSGFVGGFTDAHKGAASVSFGVTAQAAGTGSVALRYANGTGATMTLSLYVNGVKVRQVGLAPTANWDTWATQRETVTYAKGANTVAWTFTTADSGNVNIDNSTVDTSAGTGTPTPSGALEAESARLSGGAVAATDHSGFTGTGFASGLTDANKGSASVSFAVNSAEAGAGSVSLRYANGTGATMTLSLYVNGAKVRQVSLPATANWDTWGTREEAVTYAKGANTVAWTFTTADSGNVNIDSLTPATPTTPTDPGGPTTLTHQAEDAFASGGPARATAATGYEGSAYLSGFTATGARAVFAVNAPSAATYPVTVRYRTPDATASTVTLLANGTTVRRLTLPGTGGAWKSAATDVPLRAALNHVTLRTASGDNGTLQLDGIGVTGSTPNATRGATMPYTAYEAENGSTNAGTTGPDRTYLTVPSEASGRKAVVLDATGEYVQFTLTKPANALTLRYSVPDNAAGTGIDTTLSVYADGTQLRDLPLSSKYSWVYGGYPYTNVPSQGSGHHFFDETRTLLTGTLPAGTVLKFQKDAGDTAASYTLDLVETETAPAALTMPSTGFVSATTLGVTPNDSGDDTGALNTAISTATSQGKGLWLPTGTYDISGHVDLAGADLRGAGQWYTVLRGKNGKGGLFGRGGTSNVQDLMIAGDVSYRDDANFDAAVEGDFGNGSTLTNLWIQHTKVGLWIDAPTNGLYASGLRIRDTFADGVNLHKGTRATEVAHSSVRNTGDDGLAMFSEAQAVTDSAFRFNTVQLPMLANTVGIYGGHGNRVEDNLLADTVTGSSGIAISSRFAPVPFSGTTSVQRNTLTRTGGYEPNWQSKLGALWIYADSSDITAPVLVKDNDILDSTYSGLLVSWQKNVSALTVDGLKIDKAGSYGIEINSAGAGTFSRVTVSGATAGGLSSAGGFTITRGAGNTGW